MQTDTTRALADIARGAEITGIPWRSLSRFYALPERLGGLRVLDLCAGMSDSTLGLREAGAEAIALDVCYADLGEMLARNHHAFEDTARSVFHVDPDSGRGRELYRSFTAGFVASLQNCLHVAASATALPFADESFDLVISFNGIFGTLDFNAAVLEAALLESVRVLRAGGSLQVLPYQHGPVLNALERANQLAAVEALSQITGIEIEETVPRTEAGLGSVGRLQIRKTALA